MSPDEATDREDDDERFEALLASMDRLVRAPAAERAYREDPRGFLAAAGLAAEDVEHLAGLGPRRLFIYRRHVRMVLARGIRKQIPRTAARLGAAFERWVDRFVEAEAPRSRYFRDAAFEMVAWAAPRWAEDPEVPAFLGDLARHELCFFEVATTPAEDGEAATAEIALDRALVFDPTVRLARHAFAVQRLSEDEAARDEPAREATAILAYRDAEHEPRFLELSELAAAILERLLAGAPLGAAVVGAAAALGSPVDDAVTRGTAALLEDLRARGALRGGRAA